MIQSLALTDYGTKFSILQSIQVAPHQKLTLCQVQLLECQTASGLTTYLPSSYDWSAHLCDRAARTEHRRHFSA